MELLHGHRGHGLRTAALLRRSHPFDKELQVAGLLHDLGPLRAAGGPAGHPGEVLGALLGDRVARLMLLAGPDEDPAQDALRQAALNGHHAGLDAGVVEDWRPVLELVAAEAYDF
ncbi:hypothetical protein AB0P15_16645 [Streptomyces sp. NPDC087917]|uniref:hypothetical protein n=1 Tax=Streptomyces sp. NPDC087917 TaxID=3155060 RepID=UPI00344097DE